MDRPVVLDPSSQTIVERRSTTYRADNAVALLVYNTYVVLCLSAPPGRNAFQQRTVNLTGRP